MILSDDGIQNKIIKCIANRSRNKRISTSIK
jgi:hypothetical protein